MTSEEERIEVAKSIRYYAKESDESTYEFIRGYRPNDLADLIDPTCGFVECPDNDEFALRVVSGYMCLNCEHETIVERTAGGWAEPPRYCSYCGERLVSDDVLLRFTPFYSVLLLSFLLR